MDAGFLEAQFGFQIAAAKIDGAKRDIDRSPSTAEKSASANKIMISTGSSARKASSLYRRAITVIHRVGLPS
jgi:hypothetical protein